MKPFESIGVWFLPSAPETQIPGTLAFSREEGLVLKLAGTFQPGSSIENATYPLIQGVVSDSPYGRFVTLFRCFATNLRIGMPGISLETIKPHHCFAGTAFADSESMLFNEALLSFSSLAAWLNQSGLATDYYSDADNVSAKWHRPEQLHCQVPGARISTVFECDVHVDHFPRTVAVEETPAFVIEGFGRATAGDIHSRFVRPLSLLMAFVSENTSRLDGYKLFVTKDEDTESSHFDRLYSPAEAPEKTSTKTGSDVLFALGDAPGGFERFLQAWFYFVETHPDFCAMFFAYGYEKTGFLERRFLFRMLAAESLVREESRDDPTLKSFENLRETFLNAEALANEPYAALILPAAIELAMPTLFAKFVDHHWPVIRDIVGATQKRFVETLFATFNHVKNRGERRVDTVTGTNLYWLLDRLAAVIKVCVLRRLGFADEKILRIIAENSEMAHLKAIKAPWEGPNDEA